MDPSDLYKQKRRTLTEAVNLVQPHQTIVAAMAAAEPVGLLSELSLHRTRLQDVTIAVCLPLRKYDFLLQPEMSGHFFTENWFYGAPDRAVHPEGRTSYIPNNLHAAASDKLAASGGHVDIFWGTATPPDNRGFMSLSTCLVYEKQMIEAADVVVLEINKNMPWTLGDTQIHISEVDMVVENDEPLFEFPVVPPTEWEEMIGGYIADLIEDGSTLQLGFGGIPNAITAFLMERRDLGIHTEMFTDGMVDLYDAGVITGRKKSLWRGKMVGAFALGSKKLYDFVDNNLVVEFQQGRITNDPAVIAQNYKMVSVNTALQVDLLGQVCSQSLGPRHYSGTGGQLDTHRGARLSEGGRGIIALRSTAKRGTISTIVPMLSEGAGVTVPSQDVDTIVTEYGVADLKGLCVKDRLDALVRIAHPDFRDWIREQAEELKIVPRLVMPGFSAPESGRTATAAGVSADTIRLGTFCDLSGPNASIGMALLRGVTTCYDYANSWGGVHGRHIELLIEDDGFDPERSLAAAKKLVEEDEVFAIVSPLGTPTNLAVMDYLLEQDIPVISPHSGVSTWASPHKPSYFALQPSYHVEGRILAQYVQMKWPDARIAIFAVDDPFGEEGTQAFLAELAAHERKPAAVIRHDARHSSPDAWVQKLADSKPDLVLLYTYVKPAADLLHSAWEHDFQPQWLGNYVLSGPDIFRLAGKQAMEGIRATSYPPGPRSHRGERLFFKNMARLANQANPGTHSRIGYAAAQLVLEGLRRAGPDLTRDGLVQALETLDNWTDGLLPAISYTRADHRGLTSLALMRAVNGHWMLEHSLIKLQE